MFDAALSKACDLSRGNFLWFQHLVRIFVERYRLKCQIHLDRPQLGIENEEVKSRVSSSIFWEEALLLDGFVRDIDSRNHAINTSRLEKIIPSYPPFMVISERHDKQTNKLTEMRLKRRGTYIILRILSVINAQSDFSFILA